jgi:hypothetical protein
MTIGHRYPLVKPKHFALDYEEGEAQVTDMKKNTPV